MFKKITLFIVLLFLLKSKIYAETNNFALWLKDFKKEAINSGISVEVVNDVLSNARFLPKVIEYDRYQPEFYEDTFTYIKKKELQIKKSKMD